MFRKMAKANQLLSKEDTLSILSAHNAGVLAVSGDNGYPYAVPLTYMYDNGAFYFHGNRNGHKMDALRKCPLASFCVTDLNEVHGDEFTTYFRSVIAFGKVREVHDEEERKDIARKFTLFLNQQNDPGIAAYYQKYANYASFFVLEVEHMTGKVASELLPK